MSIEAILLHSSIAAGGKIASGIFQTQAQRAADEKNFKLSQQYRDDVLTQNRRTEALGREQFNKSMAIQKENLAFTKAEAEKNRVERKEATGYSRLQNAASKFTDWLNIGEGLTRNRVSGLIGRG